MFDNNNESIFSLNHTNHLSFQDLPPNDVYLEKNAVGGTQELELEFKVPRAPKRGVG